MLPETAGGLSHACHDYNLALPVLVSVFIILKDALYLCSSLSRRTVAYPVRIATKIQKSDARLLINCTTLWKIHFKTISKLFRDRGLFV